MTKKRSLWAFFVLLEMSCKYQVASSKLFFLLFFVEDVGLVEEESEEVVGCDADDDGDDGSLKMDAEIVGHMESDCHYYSYDCADSVLFFCSRSA